MKRVVFVCGLVLAIASMAQAWTITCLDGGGPNSRAYCYELSLIGGESVTSFQVGTCDINVGDYSNVEVVDSGGTPISGWTGGLTGGSLLAWPADHSSATPHGQPPPTPDHMTLAVVQWSGPVSGAGTYYFGFDNPQPPQDVGFFGSGTFGVPNPGPGPQISELWAGSGTLMGVTNASGAGPVHGPVPEPATFALMGLGLAGTLLLRRKRK